MATTISHVVASGKAVVASTPSSNSIASSAITKTTRLHLNSSLLSDSLPLRCNTPNTKTCAVSRKQVTGVRAMATESSSSIASAEVSQGDHGGLKVGYHTAQGLRDSMEDHLVVVRDIPGGFLYAGIFDGHAGSASARFLKDELYIDCMDALEGGALLSDEDLDAVEDALQDAFIQADQRLLQ
ncbi:unnamed protein product, partial [Closterium sp. NIES-53]